MSVNTLTDKQMKKKLESLGYDLTDKNGHFSLIIMLEVASMIENYEWDETRKLWLDRGRLLQT